MCQAGKYNNTTICVSLIFSLGYFQTSPSPHFLREEKVGKGEYIYIYERPSQHLPLVPIVISSTQLYLHTSSNSNFSMAEAQDILYEVRDKVAIITLNLPRDLNALNNDQYLLLGLLVERADNDPDTIITFIQSTGRYFSAGANVKDLNLLDKTNTSDETKKTNYWLSRFTSRNAYLTTIFQNHSKILVAALNGPVVGLSSALVAMCDFIYAMNSKVFLLTPFANLGLVSEGSSGATLVNRLGLSTANEALLLSRPIPAQRLFELGFVNKIYNLNDTEKFNDLVLEEFWAKVKDLDTDSVKDIKKIIRSNFIKDLQSTNAQEIIGGFYKFYQGRPQKRFLQVAQKERNHKL